MKRTAITIAIAAATLTAGAAFAQESPWMVRARAVHIDPADRSSPIGGVTESDLITVSKKTIPELDISYFFTPNWAAELVLTYPQKHTVKVDGASIGSFKHLPPTLTLSALTWAPASTTPVFPASSWITTSTWRRTAGAWRCRLASTSSSTATGPSMWM
jgi:outer membrane protein